MILEIVSIASIAVGIKLGTKVKLDDLKGVKKNARLFNRETSSDDMAESTSEQQSAISEMAAERETLSPEELSALKLEEIMSLDDPWRALRKYVMPGDPWTVMEMWQNIFDAATYQAWINENEKNMKPYQYMIIRDYLTTLQTIFLLRGYSAGMDLVRHAIAPMIEIYVCLYKANDEGSVRMVIGDMHALSCTIAHSIPESVRNAVAKGVYNTSLDVAGSKSLYETYFKPKFYDSYQWEAAELFDPALTSVMITKMREPEYWDIWTKQDEEFCTCLTTRLLGLKGQCPFCRKRIVKIKKVHGTEK